MSDEIPEDVLKAADTAWLELSNLDWPRRKDETAVIARAILAERERCADLADVLPLTELVRTNDENPKIIWRVAATSQRDAIAQAIRSSHE